MGDSLYFLEIRGCWAHLCSVSGSSHNLVSAALPGLQMLLGGMLSEAVLLKVSPRQWQQQLERQIHGPHQSESLTPRNWLSTGSPGDSHSH